MRQSYDRTKSYRKKCPICDEYFTSTRQDARYDSATCRQVASRLHRKNPVKTSSRNDDDIIAIIPPKEWKMPDDLVDFYLNLSRRVEKHWSAFGISVRQAVAARRKGRTKLTPALPT